MEKTRIQNRPINSHVRVLGLALCHVSERNNHDNEDRLWQPYPCRNSIIDAEVLGNPRSKNPAPVHVLIPFYSNRNVLVPKSPYNCELNALGQKTLPLCMY